MRHRILTTDFKPLVGGVAEYLYGIAETLSKNDPVSVRVHGVDPSPTYRSDLDVTYAVGGGFDWMEKVPELKRLRRLLSHLGWIDRSGGCFVDSALDLECTCGGCERVYLGVWNRLVHRWCDALRDRGMPYRIFTYGQEIKRPLNRPWRSRRAEDLRLARIVYACSEATAEMVECEIGGVDPRVVHPGVNGPADPERLSAAVRDLERRFDIGPAQHVLVTVGRLVQRKGVDRVLRALTSPELRHRDTRYVVVGSGPEERALRSLTGTLGLDDRVDFVGRVDDETKWAFYGLGDVFVMPNSDLGGHDWEGFGIVLLEAAVMGLPVVAGRNGGAVEAVQHGRTGLLVDPHSQQDLTKALAKLLDEPELAKSLGRSARRWVRQEFSWRDSGAVILRHG